MIIPKNPENLLKALISAFKNSLKYTKEKEEFLEAFKIKNQNYFNDSFIYATNYGIGYFCLLFTKPEFEKLNLKIKDFMNKKGIDFATEYSQKCWVFRHKLKSDKIINQVLINEMIKHI